MPSPPMSPSYSTKYAYCAAIALNNAGVSMLERGCLYQAHCTFQDATVVLKEVCRPSIEKNKVDCMMERAAKQLASPHQMTTQHCYKTKVLSCDPSMPPSASLLQATKTSQHKQDCCRNIIMPVKIDLMDTMIELTATSVSPNIDSSIIIYNCGITSFLLASSSSHSHSISNDNALLRNSYKFFNLSALVSASIHRPDDEVTTASHLVLCVLAVHGLLHVVQYANANAAVIDCDVAYYTQLGEDIQLKLSRWQTGATLLMLLTEPKVAASA